MADTFEYSGDHEWALWREGVLCVSCETWDGTETKAIGVSVMPYAPLYVSDLPEIQATPICEKCAIRNGDSSVIRFVNNVREGGYLDSPATTSFEGRSLSAMMATEPKEDN